MWRSFLYFHTLIFHLSHFIIYQICKSTLIRSIARGKTKKEPFYKFAQKSTLFNAKRLDLGIWDNPRLQPKWVVYHFYLAPNFVWERGIVLLVWVCDSVCGSVCDSVIKITQKVLDRFQWNLAGRLDIIKRRSSSNLTKITLVEQEPRPVEF